MGQQRLSAGLLALLALGCTAPRPARPASQPPLAAAVVTVVPTATGSRPAPAAPTPARATAPVGLASFGPPPSQARQHHEQAVAALRAGHVDEAKKELEQALAASPAYTEARYDLARAHARSGDVARVAVELTQVFEEDFIGTRVQAAEEPDLKSFWSSPEGLALAARKDEYEARYREVIARGLRVIVRKDGFLVGPPELLRIGVFDPQTSRFVATAPAVPRAIHAFVPPNLPYAVVVTGEIRRVYHHTPGKPLVLTQPLEALIAFPFDTSGAPLDRLDLGHVEAQHADLLLADDELQLDLHTPTDLAPPGIRDARYQLTFGKPVSRELLAHRPLPPPDAELWKAFRVQIDVGYTESGPTMAASDGRFVYRRADKNGEPDALVFPTGESVPIPELLGFHQIAPRVLPDAAGERALLLWSTGADPCGGYSFGKHKVVLVTRTGAVTYLGEDEGGPAAAFDGAGGIYVQRRNGIFRVDLPTLRETWLPGLLQLATSNWVPRTCVKSVYE